MAVVSDFDLVAIRRGALGVLMFVVPAYAIAAVAAAGDGSSSAWLLVAAAILFGSTFGGFAGARDRPATPITHGALSAAAGLGVVFAAALTVQAVQGDLTLAASLTALVILQIGTGLGMLGGKLAAKWFGPPQ